uniref:F-box domain-containing protein n=1 Tax=Clastoptera arizonana TaxID=38151 RepID=A0A1B6DFY3_9HEMI
MEGGSDKMSPEINTWFKMNSNMDQDGFNESFCSKLQTPQDYISGDSGFHSITPDSAESVENLSLPPQCFNVLTKHTPHHVRNIQFGPFISTPATQLDMMDTSLYVDDEQNPLIYNCDHLNLMETNESNLILKNENSTNFTSICSNLGISVSYDKPPVLLDSSGQERLKSNSFMSLANSNNNIDTEMSTKSNDSTNFICKEQFINNTTPIFPTCKNVYLTNCYVRKNKRFLNGIENLDILYQLGVKNNYNHIIENIFGYLTPYDLLNVKKVSTTWNQIFLNISPTQKKWKAFKRQCKEVQKENMNVSQEISSEIKLIKRRGRHTYLSAIENMNVSQNLQQHSPQISPVVSPSKRKFNLFQKEGEKLKQGERLLRCPKCTFPSHDLGSTFATCTRIGCKYEFCIFCFGVYSLNHICPPLYTPKLCKKRTSTIGSKGSKRNLRRL